MAKSGIFLCYINGNLDDFFFAANGVKNGILCTALCAVVGSQKHIAVIYHIAIALIHTVFCIAFADNGDIVAAIVDPLPTGFFRFPPMVGLT